MENSEPPKGNAESVNKELELKATELAKKTREQGMGGLSGKFPPRLLNTQHELGDYTWIGQFIQGEEIPPNDRGVLIITRNVDLDRDPLTSSRGRQMWFKSQYVPVNGHNPSKRIQKCTSRNK